MDSGTDGGRLAEPVALVPPQNRTLILSGVIHRWPVIPPPPTELAPQPPSRADRCTWKGCERTDRVGSELRRHVKRKEFRIVLLVILNEQQIYIAKQRRRMSIVVARSSQVFRPDAFSCHADTNQFTSRKTKGRKTKGDILLNK